MDVKIKLFIKYRRDGRAWIAVCPAIDVATQSDTKTGALSGLSEAVSLWFESCISRGVLHEALQECGFKRSETGLAPENADNVVQTLPAEAPRIDDSKPIEFRAAKGNQFVEGFISSMVIGDSQYQYATV